MKNEIQVLPLPKVKGYWIHKASRYPDVIKVPMSDGKVVKYEIAVEMPHPCFTAAMANLKKMCVGYDGKGKDK